MKKNLTYLVIAAVSLFTAACHKDSAITRMVPVSFPGKLTVDNTTATLSTSTDASNVLTFKWPAVSYPVKAHVTYALQADVPTDTVGNAAWANAKSILVGNDILTKTFNGSDLNTLALELGLPPNTASKMVFRVSAYQDRYAYSNGVTVSVSPYKLVTSAGYPVLYIPGDYQAWSPSTAPTVAAEQTNIYEGYIYEPAGGTYHFKFTSAPDWNHINYGDAGSGKLSTDGQAGDLVLPGPGYYELVANTSTLTWSYTLINSWSIIGDATPGGWSTDTPMSYDPVKNVWTVTANMTTGGSFKFRANNAWNIDFGVDANGKLQYADNPAYPYNGSLSNLTVPSNGNYTITLDLHDPNNYNYTLHKN